MKKLLLTIINLILIITVIAQAPQGISHQAVIRDANNQLVINTQVGVKISILRDNMEGDIVYSETHTPVSNANGLITFVIGHGTVVSGVFADIAWAEGSYFIKTQVDPSGGINYVIEGVSQILSVPYALHAKTVENLTETDPIFSSWDKSTGIEITESQIIDLDHFTNADEIDPVFSSWDKSTGIAITESQIIDLDHFTNEDEIDPIFSSWDKSTGIEITESQIIDLDHFTNEDEIDPVFSSWDKSTGIEITESQITDLKDYLTEEADGDPTNELQTVVQEDYKVTLSHDGGSFITGIMSYAQAEIDAMAPYDGLTVHNSTTNCINYYYFNNWFEFCGTCTPQPTQADAGENIWIMGGVLTVTLSANIPEFGEGKWSILSGDGGSFEDDTDPHTFFTGQPYEQYTLKWTITTSCNTSYDEIWVRFRPYVCGTPFTDTRDSNDYETVIIGNQCWMAENLKYLPEVSGPEEQSYTEPYYYVNGYDGTNVNDAKASTYYNAYGVLYNWPAAVNACPLGWHLPSDAEWTQLVDYVVAQGYSNYYGDDPNGAGNALKSCRQVNSPLGEDCATSEHPRWDSNNTHYGFDEFGFSALPGGNRSNNGLFYDIGLNGRWWSSSEGSSTGAWNRSMEYSSGNVTRNNIFKTFGYSVRCLRD
ncbi:MAG: hypothetical protein GX128_00430 [Bacteroidales bacterium]|nr:hypothetical protein [Bacteroidales bacterium]